MKRVLSFLALATVINESAFSQCTVTASALPDIIICGDCAELTAFGRGQGQLVFQENFNTGAPTGWFFTQQGRFDNPCSPSGVDGTPHIWMGNTSAVPRSLETLPYNFSTAISGVSICFDMLFSTQGNTAPCEGPDEPDEGVYLQYKIGSGQWITINYFDPNGGGDPQLINWNNWCFQLPPAATANNVSIRWFQDNDSGADYDHWGIDNVVIYFNDPSYVITWVHDGYSYPAPGGINPTKVCPHSTTDYPVVMTNNVSYCYDTVRIVVETPTILVDAGNDTTICTGDCATLQGTAKVIKSPGGPKTYFTFEPDTIQSVFGGLIPGEVNINVTRLNMTNLSSTNSILRVCIDSASAYDQVLFPGIPPFIPPIILDYNLGQFSFDLVCPDGTVVKLIPDATLDTLSNDLTGTCFVPAGGSNITSTSQPYTGSFNPNQPLSNLNGCTANGLWKLRMSSIFGQAIIKGWSITFNDIEINYDADFSWSPTSNMTNSNTLTPTVCPPSTQIYTLTAQDTAGCVIDDDDVTVNVTQNCCNLSFTGIAVNSTSCTSPNGSITLIVNSGSGSYQFQWSDNGTITSQNRSGLSPGTYSVTVTDLAAVSCQRDSSFTIAAPPVPQVTVAVVDETCAGESDGEATASAGSGTYIYVWSTSQSGPTVTGLPAGSHTVTATDVGSGCFDTETFTIAPGAVLQVANIVTEPNCGQNDGAIFLTITGTGPYDFIWSNNETTQDISNLFAGNYTVTVADLGTGCENITTINLSNANAIVPVIDNISATPETCAGDGDGTATVLASGGNGTLVIVWSNIEMTSTITGLTPGLYSVTVTDDLNCQAVGSVNVPVGPLCCNLLSSAVVVDADCNGANGSITIDVDPTSGTPQFVYSVDSINFVLTNAFTGLAPGTYYATSRDADLCTHIDTVTVSAASNTIAITMQATPVTCFGDNDGIAQVDTSGGTPPLSILWSNNSTSKTIINLAAGDYYVTVTDQSNCERKDTVTITEPAPVVVDLGAPVGFCIGDSFRFDAGSFVQYLWSTNDTLQAIVVKQSGNYSVTVYDANGCDAQSTVSVTVNPHPTVSAGLDSTIYDYETIELSPTVSGVLNPAGFQWTPDTALSCTNCQNPIASPDSSIRYYVRYIDDNNCFDTSSVYITVKDGDFYAVIPNAFSPNGDGLNETLFVYHEGLDNLVLRIYNRWGALIFETRNPDAGWDGTFKGKLLDPDVFIYTLYAEFFNFTSDRTKGSVTLLR